MKAYGRFGVTREERLQCASIFLDFLDFLLPAVVIED